MLSEHTCAYFSVFQSINIVQLLILSDLLCVQSQQHLNSLAVGKMKTQLVMKANTH